MNPVLLKPTGESRSQVILHGKVWQSIHARDYYQYAPFLRQEALKAWQELASSFEVIVIEGAGSVAEINLWDRDFANLSMAHAVGARSLLVADIERGGVFASILGTLDLLPNDCRKLIRAFAVCTRFGVWVSKVVHNPAPCILSLREPWIRFQKSARSPRRCSGTSVLRSLTKRC